MRALWSVVIACALAGCVVPGGDAGYGVHQEFIADRIAAIRKYRPTLAVRPGEQATKEQLYAAGELMMWDPDPAHYREYEQFVLAHLRTRGGGYRSSAMIALQSARGTQSLAILFDALETFEEPQAHAAINSIRNRYAAAKGGVYPEEQAYIEQETAALRKRHPDKRIALELSHDGFIVDDSF
jgi:hypothetical protein